MSTSISISAIVIALIIATENNNYLFLSLGTILILLTTEKIFNRYNPNLLKNIFFIIICASFFNAFVNYETFRLCFPQIMLIYLSFVIVVLILKGNVKCNFNMRKIFLIFFALLLVAGGLSASYITGDSCHGISVCLMPSLILFISTTLITSGRDIERAVSTTILSIILFAFFTIISIAIGFGGQMESQAIGGQLSAQVDIAGIIKYYMWANWLSAICAMIFPVILFKIILATDLKRSILYLTLMLITLYLAYKGGSRGSAISILFSGSVIFCFSSFFSHKKLKTLSIIVFTCLIIISIISFAHFEISPLVEKKFRDFFYHGLNVYNAEHRFKLIREAIIFIINKPLGNGFEKIWIMYGIDHANFYSWFIYGAGLAGVIGFFGIIFTLLFVFIGGIIDRENKYRLYSMAGFTTLVAVLIASISSADFLKQTQTLLPFWLLMGATFNAQFLEKDKKP